MIKDKENFELGMEETKIEPMYIPVEDITILMKRTTKYNGNCVSEEIVGWYHGEPNDENNKEFSNGNLKAIYEN